VYERREAAGVEAGVKEVARMYVLAVQVAIVAPEAATAAGMPPEAGQSL